MWSVLPVSVESAVSVQSAETVATVVLTVVTVVRSTETSMVTTIHVQSVRRKLQRRVRSQRTWPIRSITWTFKK